MTWNNHCCLDSRSCEHFELELLKYAGQFCACYVACVCWNNHFLSNIPFINGIPTYCWNNLIDLFSNHEILFDQAQYALGMSVCRKLQFEDLPPSPIMDFKLANILFPPEEGEFDFLMKPAGVAPRTQEEEEPEVMEVDEDDALKDEAQPATDDPSWVDPFNEAWWKANPTAYWGSDGEVHFGDRAEEPWEGPVTHDVPGIVEVATHRCYDDGACLFRAGWRALNDPTGRMPRDQCGP
jgi:hypothetical protein